MKARNILRHAGIVLLALFLLAVVPVLTHFDVTASDSGADAASSASIELPDSPSGDYLVLIRTALHTDTLSDWTLFFQNKDFPVIFEDIRCLVCDGDVTAQQLAERFQAQLPENQMTVRAENATLLASKAESGCIDVAVFSQEMADALELEPNEGLVTVIHVTGGAS